MSEYKKWERPPKVKTEGFITTCIVIPVNVKNLVIDYQKNKKGNTLSEIKRVPTIATIEEYGLGGVRVKTVVKNEF